MDFAVVRAVVALGAAGFGTGFCTGAGLGTAFGAVTDAGSGFFDGAGFGAGALAGAAFGSDAVTAAGGAEAGFSVSCGENLLLKSFNGA